MWRTTPGRRGVVITPTKCDRFDSRCAACVITRCGWSGCSCSRALCSSALNCDGSAARVVIIMSTNTR